jgi:hypothetical protein
MGHPLESVAQPFVRAALAPENVALRKMLDADRWVGHEQDVPR